MRAITAFIACALIAFALPADARGKGGSRPSYSGSKHTSSHGGSYAGGSGSSHKAVHIGIAGPATGMGSTVGDLSDTTTFSDGG